MAKMAGKIEHQILTSNQFLRLARTCQFPMRFNGSTRAEWQNWRRRWLPRLKRLMGPAPETVDLKVKTIEKISLPDHQRHKIIYRSEKNCWVPAWVLIPNRLGDHHKGPAVLCAHGHGRYGKDSVAGIDNTAARSKEIVKFNYDYGRKLLRMGYIVIAPDWRSFGQRAGYRTKPKNIERDFCECHKNCASLFGYNLLSLNVWDATIAIDVLGTFKQVDTKRIGFVGLSYGARIGSFLAAVDKRIKAVVISGALNSFTDRIQLKLGSCGSQIVHGLLRYGDMPEVTGLIAPRPLFFEKGIYDPEPSARQYYRAVARVYKAAGASGKLKIRHFKGGHVFEGTQSLKWLAKQL